MCPESGETEFWLAPGVDTETFTRVLAAFLRGRDQAVLLVLDQAGWHVSSETLAMQRREALKLKHLPPYSPELMSAEWLWELADELVPNVTFECLADLEAALAERCVQLTEKRERIRSFRLYHW